MNRRRDDIYSNDLEGAAYHESQFADYPDEYFEAEEDEDGPEEDEEEEEDDES